MHEDETQHAVFVARVSENLNIAWNMNDAKRCLLPNNVQATVNFEECKACNLQPEKSLISSVLSMDLVANDLQSAVSQSTALFGEQFQAVNNAMSELSKEEKAAYLEALEKVPNLVLSESNPIQFLEHEKGNSLSAAKRLAANWRQRRAMFGERALLPLTITGNGALNAYDIEMLKTGYLVVLPMDVRKRCALFLHPSRVPRDLSESKEGRLSRFRCFFYLLTIASQERAPLVLIRYSDSLHFDKNRTTKVLDFLDLIPLDLSAMICLLAPPPGALRFFRQRVPPITQHFYGEKTSSSTKQALVSNLIGDSPHKLLQQATYLGFCTEGLPHCAGGIWSYTNFDKWMFFRRQLEQSVFSRTTAGEQALKAHDSSAEPPVESGSPGMLSKINPLTTRRHLKNNFTEPSAPEAGRPGMLSKIDLL